MANGFERVQSGISNFLKSEEMAALNKEVAEKIMKKDKLEGPTYSYQTLGVSGTRQTGVIQREEKDVKWKELADGKLKKAARSRLGELK